MIRLGLVGCGKVGSAIATRLGILEEDYELFVYDRHPDRVDKLCKMD